jgi:ribosomal protein S18 acetylase RimI-like enzyme
MTEILSDLSPASLASANRANMYGYFRYFEHAPVFDFDHSDGITRWNCPHPFYWFNSVICSRDAVPGDGAILDETMAYYRTRKTDDIGWWLEEGVLSKCWEDLLDERGFQHLGGSPGMGVDLVRIPESLPVPGGFKVRRLTEIKDLRAFAHLSNTAFGFPPESESAAFDWLVGMGLEMPLISYLAYLDGRPVGTSSVLYHSGVAGIYNVTVESGSRGMGIGAMLTLQPLLDARQLGYKAGILQASTKGFPVYQRLGFEKNCTLDHYYCELESHA